MQLRSPKFQNVWTSDTGVKIRRSLDGTLQTPRDPNWPTISGFKMEFEGLTIAERNSLITFLMQTAGQIVGVTDFEGTDWTGVFRNEEVVFTEGNDTNCTWSVSLEFVGSERIILTS